MRMWMVNPRLLCRKHLLGEHNEIHKHRHVFTKQWSVTNRILGNQIEPSAMEQRHDAIVEEMIKRGYNHTSPYEQPDISYLPISEQVFKVNVQSSHQDLQLRCAECQSLAKSNKSNETLC